MKALNFFKEIEHENNPLIAITEFLEQERRFEKLHETGKMRFVGYVLDIGYDSATIITSDPYKVAVGGIPRGSFLILAPSDLDGLPPHFSLLRVVETAPTPLTMQVQQTYFELHKKSMPELDIWTQSELQWGALKCAVLGMFYPNPQSMDNIAFSGDVNSIVSAHRYRVYAPTAELLDVIVNGLVQPKHGEPLPIGKFRPTENLLAEIISGDQGVGSSTEVKVSVEDFKGTRTAMFGKTRLGKSNVVKLLAQAMIDATEKDKAVGQLIFDINGEYANDNEWDGSKSLRSANPDRCVVYALTKRKKTPSFPLKVNFYEQPREGIDILGSLLRESNRSADYIESFTSVGLPSIEEIAAMSHDDKTRPIRLVQMYWAVLHEAGFDSDESRLKKLFKTPSGQSAFDPCFNKSFRHKIHGSDQPAPSSLDDLRSELQVVARYAREHSNDKDVQSLLKADELAILNFLVPKGQSSTGPALLNRYRAYHDPKASNYVSEILGLLDCGSTVILDLGNATDKLRSFFADNLSRAVFSHQESKFTLDELGDHYVHLYFEEAHNLFPSGAKDLTGVYSRFAKEGAKFHIGMTYSTQSPSTIYGELLVQTENFFVGHLASVNETAALAKLQNAFSGVEEEILRSRTPGYMRMLTRSHRFVIPVQADLYSPK